MNKYKTIFPILIMFFVSSLLSATPSGDNSVIAVYPFENITQNQQYDWLSTGLMSTVITHLSNFKDWIVVDRRNLEKALGELELNLSDLSEHDSSMIVGNFLAANTYVVGDFQVAGNRILINAQVVEVESSRILTATKALGDYENEIFQLQNSIGTDLVRGINEYNDSIGLKSVQLSDKIKSAMYQKSESTLKIYEYYSIAEDAFYQANYAKAQEYLDSIIKEHPDHYRSLILLTRMQIEMAQYSRALQTITHTYQVVAIEKSYGEQELATCMYLMGVLYDQQGNYEEALKFHFEALRIRDRVYGSNHPEVADSLNGIGVVYDYSEDYDQALVFYKRALKIRLKLLGEDHPYVGDSYNNIGIIYDLKGDYESAIKAHFIALNIYKANYGENHPYTAGSYLNIGTVYNEQGLYDKALTFLYRSLDVFETVYGTEHPDTADAYYTIGTMYENQKNYDHALRLYRKAFEIQEKILGPDHPETVSSYKSIERVENLIN